MTETSELAEIRRDLREMRWYLEDPELRERVSEWIDKSHDEADADTARQYLETELNSILATNAMYHTPDLNRGEDGFPDRCADCRHYGSACPVLLDDTEVRWRERELEQAETEQEARRIYQQQAIDVSCQLIPDLLETWDNQHADFIREGQQILSSVEDEIINDGKDATTDAEPVLPDGGSDA